jgi:glycosyltransferase involved in cell wall biosynthesis
MSKYLPLDSRIPVVVTVHDLNFLRDGRQERVARERRRIEQRLQRAAAVTAISRFVAADLEAEFDLGGKLVHVIHNGLAPPPEPSPHRPAFLPDGPFLFSIGNLLGHKNFHVLLDLLQELPGERLVIAGKKATPYGRFLAGEIAARGLGERAIMPGEISDGDRQWLYANCEAFLFPSVTEGFGLPVLEAMQCGRPVFLSRATSLPEIGGSLAFYFDGFGAEEMAATLREGMRLFHADPDYPEKLREHAARFSWRAAAHGYIQVYREVLAAAGTSQG